MEHVRLLLAIVLTIMVFVLWELLFVPERPEMPPEAPEQTQTEKSGQSSDSRDRQQADEEKKSDQAGGEKTGDRDSTDSAGVPAKQFNTISVEHDLYRAEFAEKGAAVKRFVLRDYRVGPEEDASPRVLVSEENEEGTALVRFAGTGLPDT
ncbi:MAG: membrane protein insertase YidC, partial [Thermodesulfobacteriota bacterium]